MKVLGISPLDKDATVSLVEDGRVLFAAGEERFSRVKQHAGFPARSLDAALAFTGMRLEEVDLVAYPFLGWEEEASHIRRSLAQEDAFDRSFRPAPLGPLLEEALTRVPTDRPPVHGLKSPDQRMDKAWWKEWAYRALSLHRTGARLANRRAAKEWQERAVRDHRAYHEELERELAARGLKDKLKRYEHHLSHAANAYLASGFDRALIVTLDGYGTGLAGSLGLGEGGRIRRLAPVPFPHSLGTFYETVTASLGFHPDRHAGKIVGLAAYGDPLVLGPALLSRFDLSTPGTYHIHQNLNVYLSRHLASHFPMVDVAAAYQWVLEQVACAVVRHWVKETGADAVVLSGGVTANVKMNQRIHAVDGVRRTFVYPNMGDGGCASGIALHASWEGGPRESIQTAYLGPSYGEADLEAALRAEDLPYTRPEGLAGEVARLIHGGRVVGRFDGRMEYGPRALGNRSILYHAREPEVNHWLNQRLGRTEFMPFAPVTLWEARERCYVNLAGAEHAAEFMTITFDCTEWMIQHCPAAVHVDGTARPQLIRREVNPGYYDILKEYEALSGIPCLINTSFNMHEEPIVCTPADAVRAFLLGNLDALVLGPFLVQNPKAGG